MTATTAMTTMAMTRYSSYQVEASRFQNVVMNLAVCKG